MLDKFLPLCCEWVLRLWVCIWASGITPEETLSSPVTQLCSSPALPSLQPLFSPAGRGCPSTWTGPSLLPRSEPWMLDTWQGWSDCRRGRSDALQPGDKKICYGPFKQKTTILTLDAQHSMRTISTEYIFHQTGSVDWQILVEHHWSGLKIKLKIKLRLTTSPIKAARFGATWLILDRRYSCSSSR